MEFRELLIEFRCPTIGLTNKLRLEDIAQWIGEYDEEEALKGQAWLSNIRAMDRAPAPERSARNFCRMYCKFYNERVKVDCPGKSGH